MRHKHADAIIAWANGAVIQNRLASDRDWSLARNPYWDECYEYRASLAIVEGKPVFEGDVLWCLIGMVRKVVAQKIQQLGDKDHLHVTDGGDFDLKNLNNSLSWNPPKPKTVTIELLRVDAEFMTNALVGYFTPPMERIINACKEALK